MVGLVTRNPPASRSTACAEESVIGLQPDEHEGGGGREAEDLVAVPVAGHDGGEPAPLPLELDDVHAGADVELRVGPHPFLEHGRGGQAGAGKHPDLLGELRQVQALLQGRVAAADHHHLVGPLVEGPVAGRAEVDAGADEVVLAGHVKAPVRRAGGHDHGVGGELLARRQRGDQVIVVVLDGGDRHRGNELHPVAARLGHEPVGQLAAGDAVGEPRVVVDPVADPGLAAQGAGVHDDRVDALAGGVDGGRQPGRPASHDDQVVGGPVGFEGEADAAGQRLVARVHLVRAVAGRRRWG